MRKVSMKREEIKKTCSAIAKVAYSFFVAIFTGIFFYDWQHGKSELNEGKRMVKMCMTAKGKL